MDIGNGLVLHVATHGPSIRTFTVERSTPVPHTLILCYRAFVALALVIIPLRLFLLYLTSNLWFFLLIPGVVSYAMLKLHGQEIVQGGWQSY